jgi:hypothetical protein
VTPRVTPGALTPGVTPGAALDADQRVIARAVTAQYDGHADLRAKITVATAQREKRNPAATLITTPTSACHRTCGDGATPLPR